MTVCQSDVNSPNWCQIYDPETTIFPQKSLVKFQPLLLLEKEEEEEKKNSTLSHLNQN